MDDITHGGVSHVPPVTFHMSVFDGVDHSAHGSTDAKKTDTTTASQNNDSLLKDSTSVKDATFLSQGIIDAIIDEMVPTELDNTHQTAKVSDSNESSPTHVNHDVDIEERANIFSSSSPLNVDNDEDVNESAVFFSLEKPRRLSEKDQHLHAEDEICVVRETARRMRSCSYSDDDDNESSHWLERGDEVDRSISLSRSLSRQSAMRHIVQEREEKFTSQLSEDTFSFLITSNVCSIPYCTGMCVLGLKVAIFVLIAVGLVNGQPPSNPIGIPAAVSTAVAISQFLALFITVASQDDVITSLTYMFEGYQPEMGYAFETNSYKWASGVVALFLTGALGLIVTFLLITSSDQVVDLILNFTAVEFVSLLDNVAFALAVAGFLGGANQKEALLITSVHYDIPKHRQKSPIQQIIFLVTTFFVLLTGWAAIYALQVRGQFLPQTIVVQFDDNLAKEMGPYSGIYTLKNDPWKGQYNRIYYWAKDYKGAFAYCKPMNSWTFSITDYDKPCLNFLAKSSDTDTFDLTETVSKDWFVTADSNAPRFFPMNNFYLSVGCSEDDDCGGPGHGTCVKDLCKCNSGFYGIRCDYEESRTCERLELESGHFRGTRLFANEYVVLKTPNGKVVQTYNHPVYTSIPESGGGIDVMLYLGTRWALLYATNGFSDLTTDKGKAVTRDDLVAYFDKKIFNAVLSLKKIEFVSEPVLFNTASDEATPKGLRWSIVRGDSLAALEVIGDSDAVLLCAVCNDETNPCLNDNVCLDGSCACENGAQGRLCQVTPLSNGRCDPYFNEAAFNFDGGDCCESTCISTSEHACGMQEFDGGTLESADIGFQYCIDNAIISSEGAFWGTKSAFLPFLSPRYKGLITLSENGFMLVSSEPILDVVRLFDQVDSQWEQRGPLLEGPRNSHFGRKIGLSTPPGAVSGRRFGKVPVYLAIAYHGDTYAAVKVTHWQPNDVDWRDFPELRVCQNSYPKNCDIEALDIGYEGFGVTLAVELTNGTVSIYTNTWDGGGTRAWNKTGDINGTFVTMSGKGDLIAVRSPSIGIVDIYQQQFGAEPVLSDYGGLKVFSRMKIEEDADSVQQIRLSDNGGFLGVAVYGKGEVDYLGIFVLYLGRFTFWGGTKNTSFAVLSQDDVDQGLSSIVFGGGGTAVAVRYGKTEERIIRVYQYRPAFGWGQLGADFSKNITSDRDFSISHDGSQLAYGDVGHVETHALIPRCDANETLFHLSITLDEFPANVTWSLEFVKSVSNLPLQERVLKSCYNCYDDNDRYGRARIVEDICIPDEKRSCIRFTFQSTVGLQEGAGFAAFFNTTEVVRYDGTGTDPIVWMPSDPTGMCAVEEKVCASGFSLFTLALTLDLLPEETSWQIRDSNNTLLSELPYETYSNKDGPGGTTVVDQHCLPSDACMSFTIFDKFGDGNCCKLGQGAYAFWWKGKAIASNDGIFAAKERTIFGENCVQTTTDAPTSQGILVCGDDELSVHISLKLDAYPEEVTWVVRTNNGNVVAESGAYFLENASSDVVHAFCIPSDECYSFTFQDSLGDGLIDGGEYSLSLNGEEILRKFEPDFSVETSYFGGMCPALVPITIYITFDIYPEETSWIVADDNGLPIHSAPYFFYSGLETANTTVFVKANETYSVTFKDLYGDGFCCEYAQGTFSIFLGQPGNFGTLLLNNTEPFDSDNVTYSMFVPTMQLTPSSVDLPLTTAPANGTVSGPSSAPTFG